MPGTFWERSSIERGLHVASVTTTHFDAFTDTENDIHREFCAEKKHRCDSSDDHVHRMIVGDVGDPMLLM